MITRDQAHVTQLELSSGSTLPLPHFINVLQVEVCVVKSLGSVWSGRSRRARVFHTLYLSATGEAAGREVQVLLMMLLTDGC